MDNYNGLSLSKFMDIQGREYMGYYGELNLNEEPIASVEDDGFLCQTFVSFYKPEYKEVWGEIKEKFRLETEPDRRGIDDWKLVDHLIGIYKSNAVEEIPRAWGHSKV